MRAIVWELRTWLPGEADFCRAPASTKLSAAMAALAGFHRAAATFPARGADGVSAGDCPAAVGNCSIGLRATPRGWLRRLSPGAGRNWPPGATRAATIRRPRHRGGGNWNKRRGLKFRSGVYPRHLARPRFVFGDRVSGIIDFGGLGWDNVAMDVARLFGSLTVDYGAYWRQGWRPTMKSTRWAKASCCWCQPLIAARC